MQNTFVHYEGTASLEAVATKVKPSGAVIKIGLDNPNHRSREKSETVRSRRLALLQAGFS
jgi:hypothetical protein